MTPNPITPEQRSVGLRAVNVIKEKRRGVLKGCTCTDGSKQRNLLTKEETVSPTMLADALLMSLIIDAKEGWNVATSNIIGAYLHANMADFTPPKLTGTNVNIMCRVNPKYILCVIFENGVKVLHLQLLKVLYGCVQLALLWYNLHTNVLEGLGFVLNPYDMCVTNMEIEGIHCTILWYIDNNKILHVSKVLLSKITKAIEDRFGKMVVTCSNSHIFLGMEIKFPGDSTVKTRMRDHLQECINDIRSEVTQRVATPTNV